MSLAQSISDQLNGRRSGTGFVIPAVCHSPDSQKFNLQISDGANGKLSAFCHSGGCTYQKIMQALESQGLKPRDDFSPEQKMRFKSTSNKTDKLKALVHEMFVLTRFFDSRLNDLAKARDKNYLKFHPEFKAMPAEFWEREREALNRINLLTGELL